MIHDSGLGKSASVGDPTESLVRGVLGSWCLTSSNPHSCIYLFQAITVPLLFPLIFVIEIAITLRRLESLIESTMAHIEEVQETHHYSIV